jgi:CHASE3 domain sensor protein
MNSRGSGVRGRVHRPIEVETRIRTGGSRFAAILPALMVLLILGTAFAAIASAVRHAHQIEQHVRSAQLLNTRLLRLQLDEETGVRGYLATGDRSFLQPYQEAKGAFDVELESLRAVLEQLAPAVVAVIDDQKMTHRRWLEGVVEPLVVNPKRSSSLELQREGKRLIDHFRNDNEIVARELSNTAERSDAAADDLVNTIIVIGVAVGTTLLSVSWWIGSRHQRLEKNLEVQTAFYDRERDIADALQRALIPSELPSIPGLLLHARYRPAEEASRVGGDWYDAFALSDGRIFISLGDVMGHGIVAVEMMSRFRNAIIAAAMRETDPGAVLTAANRSLLQIRTSEPVIGSAVCGVIDPITREIAYATAGHPPPILVLPGRGAHLLAHDSVLLGLQDHVFQTHVAHAIGSALLVFYTDGLIEFTRDIVAGETRLLEAAREVASRDVENPALAIKDQILGGAAPSDDVAILTVTFAAEPNATVVLPDVPSRSRDSRT